MQSEKYVRKYVSIIDGEYEYGALHVDDELLESLPENVNLSLGDKLELKEIIDNFCRERRLAQIGEN